MIHLELFLVLFVIQLITFNHNCKTYSFDTKHNKNINKSRYLISEKANDCIIKIIIISFYNAN